MPFWESFFAFFSGGNISYPQYHFDPTKTDAEKLAEDWERVGKDFKKVLGEYK